MNWHSISAAEALAQLNVNQKQGLTGQSAAQRQKKYGKNKLAEKKPKSLFLRFLEQFSDFMVIVLLIAAAISFFTARISGDGDYIDSIIILLIVIINAITGVVQESKAEKAIAALKKLSAPHARVIRNSKPAEIASEDLVPGDILLLEAGDFVPADARLLEAVNLKAEESALTGESLSVEKNASARCPEAAPLGDRKNMVFSSSTITAGHGTCVVTSTGMETQVGRIAHMINQEDSPQTPLQQKLAQTGKYLGIGALIICLVIFLLGLMESVPPLEMFMISISLAVAAIPEGLPAVVAIVVAMLAFLLIRDTPQSTGLPPIEKYRNDYPKNYSEKSEQELTTKEIFFKYVLNNKILWYIAFANAFVYLVRYGVLDWAPTYLKDIKGYDIKDVGWAYSAYEWAAIPGTIICGWLSDKVFKGRRAITTMIYMALVAVFVVIYWKNMDSVLLDNISLIAIGFLIYGPVMLIGVQALDLAPKKAAGTAAGLTGFFGYFFGTAILANIAMGSIVQHLGWDWGFIMLLAACALAFLFISFTYREEQYLVKQRK